MSIGRFNSRAGTPGQIVVLLAGTGAGAAIDDHRGAKTEDQTVAAGHSIDPACWLDVFEVLMGRIAGRFARVEPRRRARALVLGLLSEGPATQELLGALQGAM
ncbi:hypothetical protein [Streptomyces sp. NPDC054834]